MSISMSMAGATAALSQPGQSLSASVTRILSLSGFPPELKTRDIHHVFSPWENDKGGFKIKWIDDTSALIVFQDATVAKRAYLQTLLSPPPMLSSPTSTKPTLIKPYDGPDAQAIIANVNARTTTTGGTGARRDSRASFSIPNGLATGHIRAASMAAAVPMSGANGGLPASVSTGALGTMASKWAPKPASATASSPTLPNLPYQPTLNALITSSLTPNGAPNGNGSALSTSSPGEYEPASLNRPQIGDPGRRLVAGALGMRHPTLMRSPDRVGSGGNTPGGVGGVEELTKAMAATEIQV